MDPVNNSKNSQIRYNGKREIRQSIATTGCLLNVFTTHFIKSKNKTMPTIIIIVTPSMGYYYFTVFSNFISW
jgi:uncharacterized membrane protein (UPF0136 family)